MRLTLPKSRRLKQRRDFICVKEHGRRIAQGCLVINWREVPAGGKSRVGIITTKALGSAVIRSRARRRIREAFRHQQAELLRSADIVLIARSSIRNISQDQVAADLTKALRRAGLTSPSPPRQAHA